MRKSMQTLLNNLSRLAILAALATPAYAELPDPGMAITAKNTALVITDPQNDFLSPKGVTWGVVGEAVTREWSVATGRWPEEAKYSSGMFSQVIA